MFNLRPAVKLSVVVLVSVSFFPVVRGQSSKPPLSPGEAQIVTQLKGLRGVPDTERPAATRKIALLIRALPPDKAKVGLANGLASLATEGDFGHDTLEQVAVTFAGALFEQPDQGPHPYSELARLIRYEHVAVSFENAQLKNALAQLEAEDRDRQQANFTLSDLKGKSWTLQDLHGHVVLVNFWATWCPPCRKEMPDLNALYEQFKNQGLVILAISDEDASKVTPYLKLHPVSYPILLDPGRKVNDQFHIQGIPKSFVYDRNGKLAAQSIDMRTKTQFLQMLKDAGLYNDTSASK